MQADLINQASPTHSGAGALSTCTLHNSLIQRSNARLCVI
jgi:hypothetical protein